MGKIKNNNNKNSSNYSVFGMELPNTTRGLHSLAANTYLATAYLRRYRSHNFFVVRFFVAPVVTYQKMSAANLYLSVGRRYGAKGVFDLLCDLDLDLENFKVKS